MIHKVRLAGAVLLLSIVLSGGHNYAASATTPVQGLVINPSLKNITLQPNQSTSSFAVKIANETNQVLVITPVASDFSTSGVNGAIDLKHDLDPKHGLASHISFSSPRQTLDPGKDTTLGVTINGADTLSPGGHFAAIRYRAMPQQSGQGSVSFQSELVSFLFVTTAGQATYDLKAQWSLPHFIFGNLPSTTNVLFTNNGNTQAAPHGTIAITDPRGTRVAQAVLNSDGSLVLPGATRLLQTNVHKLHAAFLPGHYAANIYYRASAAQGYSRIQTPFIFISWLFIGAVAFVLLGIGVIVYWFIKRRHKKYAKAPVLTLATPAAAQKPKKGRSIPVRHL